MTMHPVQHCIDYWSFQHRKSMSYGWPARAIRDRLLYYRRLNQTPF